MNLKSFAETGEKYAFDAIAEDTMLTLEIQEALAAIDLLKPSFEDSSNDQELNVLTEEALLAFQANALPETSPERQYSYFGEETAKALIDAQPASRGTVILSSSTSNGKSQTGDMASRIYNYMVKKGYVVSTGRKEYDIVYIEGMNPDFTLNNDAPNEFNDLRLVLELQEGKPAIVGKWEGTTEPGRYYTIQKVQNPNGAARITFGQQRCWKVDIHRKGKPSAHEALVQHGNITVHRDRNKDFKRTNDKIYTGNGFGINQHSGFNYPKNDIKMASAGCLVGRTTAGHQQFMEFVKQDKRYKANKNYIFYTTVIAGDELMKPEHDVVGA